MKENSVHGHIKGGHIRTSIKLSSDTTVSEINSLCTDLSDETVKVRGGRGENIFIEIHH